MSAALDTLTGRDPVLDGLMATFGPPPARRRVPTQSRFGQLVRAIVYQQLAGVAAQAIHGRLVAALGNEVSAERVLLASPETLALCGLSSAKAASIRDLAERVASGEIALERIGRLGDDEVVAHLTLVRGIGPWTAQMFLMNTLSRLDVWPTGDFGVRAGFSVAWGHDGMPSPRELERLGEPFRPYRSLVAWYCWQAADEAKVKTKP
jgi:3-methyladenine DNA glycosylase/8-oxoguanine DNA glycosylase